MKRAKLLADLHTRIAACQKNGILRAVTICFFGDSNTRGMAIDPDRHRRAYPSRVLAELADRYAPCAFNGLDAGIPGDTISAALERIDTDVLRYAPDLTIIAFALNDAVQGGWDGLATYHASLGTAIDRIQPTSAVVLLTPCMMATRVTDRVPPANRNGMDVVLHTQNDGILDAYVAAMRKVATERTVPLADAYALWQAMATHGTDTTALLANGINHPLAYMHDLYVTPIMASLEMGVEEACS